MFTKTIITSISSKANYYHNLKLQGFFLFGQVYGQSKYQEINIIYIFLIFISGLTSFRQNVTIFLRNCIIKFETSLQKLVIFLKSRCGRNVDLLYDLMDIGQKTTQ